MPNNPFEIHITLLPRFFWFFLNLDHIPLAQNCWKNKGEPTIGSHPTIRPPPIPFPFRNSTGRFVHRAITG